MRSARHDTRLRAALGGKWPERPPRRGSRDGMRFGSSRRPGALVAAALACLVAWAAAGCRADDGEAYYGAIERPAGKDPHTLYVNNGSEPEYLDPGKVNDSASGALVDSLFEGLLTYAPDASPVPAMRRARR